MNTSDSRAAILKQLFSQYGDELLRDRQRFAGLILDHLGGERIARFLIKSLDEDILKRVLDLGGADADVLMLDQLVRTLHEEEGYDKTIAQEVVNLWHIGLQGLKQFNPPPVLPPDPSPPPLWFAEGVYVSPALQQKGWQKRFGWGYFINGYGIGQQYLLLVFTGGAGVFERDGIRPLLWVESAVETAAFAEDRLWLAIGMPDGTIEIWDLEKGRCQLTFRGHTAPTLLRFSGDRGFLVSGDQDGWIRIWDTTSGLEVRRWQADKNGLLTVAFTVDGTGLITAGKDSYVRLWDIASGRLLKDWPIHRPVYSLVPMPDGRGLITGDERMVALWDWDSGSFLKNIVAHPDTVRQVEFLSNGWLLSASEKVVICSKVGDERFIQRMDASPFMSVQAVCLPDETILVAEYGDSHLRVCNIANHDEEWLLLKDFSQSVRGLAFSPQSDQLVFATDDRLFLLRLSGDNQRVELGRLRAVVNDLAFLGDGKRLVFCGADGCLRLAEIGRQGPGRVLFQSTDWLNALVVLPGGERVAVGGDNDGIALVQVADGRVVRQWSNGTAATALACSPDGRYLAAGGEDGSLAVWGVSSGQLRFRHSAHQGIVRSVAFSNDGSWLASGGEDGVVQVFGLPAGQQMHRFTHPSWVTRIVFHPQDAILATACGDGSLWLRSLSSRCKEIRRRLSGETISGLAFSPNGDLLAVSSEDGTLAIWKVDQLLR